ncbi:hypothetical protein ACIP5N_32140 [Streptomyces sp. NPDC088768]|uniref:hypothetical protein n=1 Tax=Streptomyces sp. NPDC088768 TaxID=3365894 RepID=UPI0037FB5B39
MSCNDCCPPIIFGTGSGGTPGPQGPPGPAGPQGPGACVSTDPGNALQEGTDGCLYVAESTAPEVCVAADSADVLAVDADGCLSLTTDPAGPIRPGEAGLTLCLSDDPGQTAALDGDGCLLVTGGPAALPLVTMTTAVEVFTGDGTFDPAAYPGLQYVRVRVQGAGGGSTGSGSNAGPVGSDWVSIGVAGGGGAYAESLLNAADLTGPIAVTVGAGGAESAVNVNAGAGGGSAFGTLVTAPGGSGGQYIGTGVPASWDDARARFNQSGGAGGVGQLRIPGGSASPGFAIGGRVFNDSTLTNGQAIGTKISVGGGGGGSVLGAASRGGLSSSGAGDEPTIGVGGALGYGGGAPAPASASGAGVGGGTPSPAQMGRDGAPGVVVVEVYQLQVTAA